MSVTLTDEQYGIVMHALRKIARGRKDTERGTQRYCRDDLVTLAREACDQVGWPYYRDNSSAAA